MQVSPLLGRGGALSTAASRYYGPGSNNATSGVTTDASARQVMAQAGTFLSLTARVILAPGTGTSWVFTLVKNGVDTAMTCTIADAATSAGDAAHPIDYVAGDTVSIKVAPVGTPAATSPTFHLEDQAAGQSLLTGDSGVLSSAAPTYLSLQNGLVATSAAGIAVPLPTAGVIRDLELITTVAAGAAKSWTATLVKNGADTALTAVISGAAQVAGSDHNAGHAVSFGAGDTGYWRIDPAGAPATARVKLGAVFLPTLAGESIQTAGSSSALANSGSNFASNAGGPVVYSATESARNIRIGTLYEARKLYVILSAAPGAGKSYTATVRAASADTALAVTVSDAAVSGSNVIDTGALGFSVFSVGIVGAGAPSTPSAQWGFVTYRQPPARSLAIGQVVETPSALAMGRLKARAVGLVTETPLAQPLGRRKARAIAQVIESPSALSLGRRKTRGIAQVIESPSALPLGRVKSRMIGLVSETGTALPLGARKALALALVEEINLALPLIPPPAVVVVVEVPSSQEPEALAELALPEALLRVARSPTLPAVAAVVGWHGPEVEAVQGIIALVRPDGAWAGLVGEVLRLRRGSSVTFVWVYASSADIRADLSVSRRAFMEFARPAEGAVPVVLEVCQ